MFHWSKFPFIRFIIPLITGILLCYYLDYPFQLRYTIIALLVIVLIVVNQITRKVHMHRWRWLFGFCLNVVFIAFGYKLLWNSFELRRSDHFSAFPSANLYTAQVIDHPAEREKSIRMTLRIISLDMADKKYKCNGKTLCYIKKDANISIPEYGDLILFSKNPVRVERTGNPGEFDYAGYLQNKRIYHSVYLYQKDLKIISHGNGNIVRSFAYKIRGSILNQINKYNSLSLKEYSIAAAILTGYDEIDKTQREAYSDAGVIHILSVSGLHVGVVYLMAQLLISMIIRKGRYLFLQPVFVLCFIWFYALITGMSVPVLRASLMFSMILIGKALRLQNNNFNILAAAAFVLLLIDPLAIFDIGFQLSFGAVAGIMLFKAPIAELWSPKNPILVQIWNLIAISIAAQILITPLILYYFHRFPVYFMLANLFAVPLSGLIIYTGAIFIISTIIPFLARIIACILMSEIKVLNVIIDLIDRIPGAVIGNIHISLLMAAVILVLLICCALFISTAKKQYIYASLVCIIIIASGAVVRSSGYNNQQFIVFHKINRHTLISFINDRNQIILTDSILSKDINKAAYQLDGLKVEAGIRNQQIRHLHNGGSFVNGTIPEVFIFKGRRIVILNDNCILPDNTQLDADYVVLCNNALNCLADIKNNFPHALIIADNSFRYQRLKDIEAESALTGIPFYNIRNKGALVVGLNP